MPITIATVCCLFAFVAGWAWGYRRGQAEASRLVVGGVGKILIEELGK